MRISDWSSDVCSSDLFDCPEFFGLERVGASRFQRLRRQQGGCAKLRACLDTGAERPQNSGECHEPRTDRNACSGDNDGDRKGAEQGQRVSVRVDRGGRRILKKNTTTTPPQYDKHK